MKVFYSNIRSAKHNLLNLTAQLTEENIDIYALTETWYLNDYYLFIPNFSYSGIGDRKGGGVGFYVNNKIKYIVLKSLCLFTSDIESYVIRITPSNETIVVIYRPHTANFHTFLTKCESILSKLGNSNIKKIICGDFNFDFNAYTPCSTAITDLFEGSGLSRKIYEPTRVTSTTSTCIDNVFTNTNSESRVVKNLDVSDHYPIEIKINTIILNESTFEIRDFSLKNLETFKNQVATIRWESLYKISDVNVAFEFFGARIKGIYMDVFKTKHIKKNAESWINNDLKCIIKNKHKLHKIAKKRPSPENISTYNSYRNYCNNQIRNARSRYIYNKFTQAKTPKDKWKVINQVTARIQIQTKLSENITPNEFNTYFTTNINSNQILLSPTEAKTNDSTFALFEVTTKEIAEIIQSLSSTSTAGFDDLHPKPIKYIANLILLPLVFLINLSFKTGVYPDNLKKACITPVFKKGDLQNIGNYRPISVLSVIAKIYDKCFYIRLSSFCEKHTLISKFQFGFRSGMGTDMAITRVYNDILNALDGGLYCLGIFLDLEKAFDSVPHDRLLQKLNQIGIRGLGLHWIKSYLSERQCCTKINKRISDPNIIRIGVPQGSILSPLLFNIYINDLTEKIRKGLYLYADDTIMIISHVNLEYLIETANNALGVIKTWLENNGLKLNISKTEYIIFENINKQVNDSICTIKIGNNIIQRVFKYKYLGLWLDHRLSFDIHTNEVSKKLNQACYKIFQSKLLFPRKTLIEIYHALFYPLVIYGIHVWGNTSNNNIGRLQVIQKRVIRNIFNTSWLAHTKPLFKKCRLLNIKQIHAYFELKFIHTNLKTADEHQLFSKTEILKHPTRSSIILKLPQCRTTKKLNSIFYSGCKQYNDNCKYIKECNSLSLLKKTLKNVILDMF